MVNLEKEAPGIRANEEFWKLVEATLLSTTPLACAEAVAVQLTQVNAYDANIERMSAGNPTPRRIPVRGRRRMRSWCAMFRQAG
jgi:hypothetical protein